MTFAFSIQRFVSLLCVLLVFSTVEAAPSRRSMDITNDLSITARKQNNGATTKAAAKKTGSKTGTGAGAGAGAAAAQSKITTATDGSTILDKTVVVK